MPTMIVLDCENLFKSARLLYGQTVYVDYKKVTDLMILRLSHLLDCSIEALSIQKLAFAALKPRQYTQLDFLSFLNSIGYEVKYSIGVVEAETGELRKRKDYFDWMARMVEQACESGPCPSHVLIACGSVQLRPLYFHLQRRAILLEVFGFEGSMSTRVYGVRKHLLDRGFLCP
jgi:hypothetical protein